MDTSIQIISMTEVNLSKSTRRTFIPPNRVRWMGRNQSIIHRLPTNLAIAGNQSAWSCTVNASPTIATVAQPALVSAATTWANLIPSEFKPSSTFWCATHKPSDRRKSSTSRGRQSLTTRPCQMHSLATAVSTCLSRLLALQKGWD